MMHTETAGASKRSGGDPPHSSSRDCLPRLSLPLQFNPAHNSAKKSQQFGRTIRRACFSAKCFPVTRIMALAPQTHCPFGCCVVRDMWKPLLAEKKFSSCWLYKTKNGICRTKMIGGMDIVLDYKTPRNPATLVQTPMG